MNVQGCAVEISVNGLSEKIQNKIQYKSSLTPSVLSVEPFFGWQLGGDTIQIKGSQFGSDPDQVSVLIDKIACVVQSVNDSTITCVTGNKGA